MRLDHLLSKENIVFCFVTVWVLVSTWLVTVFCRRMWVLRVVARFFRWETAAHISCVWFGISETRMSVFVFGFVLLCGMLLGV